MSATVVAIDDSEEILAYVEELLVDAGFIVHTATTGLAGKALVEKINPDIVLLDLKLPDIHGESLCKEFKEDYPEIVVIMLTAKDTPADLANGLNIGADDYVSKPFSAEELVARIQARTRDYGKQEHKLVVADLVLDPAAHVIMRGEEMIDLSPQEFKLLQYLMVNVNQVLSREMILSRIWGTAADVETRVVDVYIGYLRKKIDKEHEVKLLKSIRGFGYMLKEPEK